MLEINGQCNAPFLIIHGGAGPRDPAGPVFRQAAEAIRAIAADSAKIVKTGDVKGAVAAAIAALEEDEQFNAGYGSCLQQDGVIRTTASYMDSAHGRFSGVINCQNYLHPSAIAVALQNDDYRVLSAPGCQDKGASLGLKTCDLVSTLRRSAFEAALERSENACDTVGAVAWHPQIGLAAMTSTGGVGFETPGRVSDAATVAGNYCSRFAGISATGRGEEIVDDAVAARLEARICDGMNLADAAHRSFAEAVARGSRYGWIAASGNGHWNVSHTTQSMVYCAYDTAGKLLIHCG